MRTTRSLATTIALLAIVYPASAQFGPGAVDSTPAWKSFKLDPKVRVRLDFRNASVDAVLQVLSQASGIAIIKDPALTGSITLQSPGPQTLASAFAMLTTAMTLRNCDITKQDGFLVIKQRVVQTNMRGFGGMSSAGSDALAGFMGTGSSQSQSTLVVYPLKYASATQVAKVVSDVFTQTALDLMASGAIGGVGGGPGGMMGGGPSGMMGGGPGGMMGGGPGGLGGGPGGMMGGGPGGMGGGPGGMMGGIMAGGMMGGGRRTGATSAVVKASADEYSNSVIVTAPRPIHEQIAKLVSDLDRKTDQPQASRVFPLQYANASDLVTVIQNVLTNNANTGRGGSTGTRTTTTGGFPGPFGFGSSSSSSSSNAVVAETRTNSLIVTAIPDILTIVDQVVKQLDKPVTFENSAFVVILANAKADNVAQLLNQSFSSSRSAANTSTSSTRTTTSTGSNRSTTSNSTPSLNSSRAAAIDDGSTSSTGAESRAAAVAAQGGGGFGMGMQFGGQGSGSGSRSGTSSSTSTNTGYDGTGKVVNVRNLSGDVVAIADTNTNSVIVVTSPQNRKIIEGIIEQLDKIPEQVMIETLIVEASLDATNKLGVEWSFAGGSSTGSTSYGLKADTSQPQGLRYTLSTSQYTAFVQAVNTDSRFEVLSTPRIFTSNNSAAEINISQSLPYVTNSRVDSNGNYSYSYSFMDVGIVLSVTPRITSNGYVTMDVTQTANDFVRYTDFNAPVVNQREAQTTVSVKDGETVVLGGIIKNSVSTTANKVPLLGDIPLLGHLFRSTSKTSSKTELLVFLTPKVVRDPDEARRLSEETQAQIQSKSLDRLLKSGGVSRSVTEPEPIKAEPAKQADTKPTDTKPTETRPAQP